jgi:hypothetical protein
MLSNIIDKIIPSQIYSSRKDHNNSFSEKQSRLGDVKEDKISDIISTVTCLNCNVKVPITHWNKHKTEVHMKGVSFLRLLKEIESVDDGLNLKTCIKYMFKKV